MASVVSLSPPPRVGRQRGGLWRAVRIRLLTDLTRVGVGASDTGNDKSKLTTQTIGTNLGLLGIIVSKLMGYEGNSDSGDSLESNGDDENEGEEKLNGNKDNMRFTLSMIEIAGEDVLRDLLLSTASSKPSEKKKGFNPGSPSRQMFSSPTRKKFSEKSLQIRHPDTKGAVVYNAVEETIESMSHLETLIKSAFHSKSVLQSRKMEGGRGHIIATLKVYPNSSDFKAKPKTSRLNRKTEENYILIQLVDLACAETEHMEGETNSRSP